VILFVHYSAATTSHSLTEQYHANTLRKKTALSFERSSKLKTSAY